MSKETKIEWATGTFNPWEGCTKVSPGCLHCYAEARNHRFGNDNWGKGKPRRRTSDGNWKKPVKWNKDASMDRIEAENFGAVWEPPRIFPSLCDPFDREASIKDQADFMQLMFTTQNIDWLLLTKRPENVLPLLFKLWDEDHCKYGARPWIREWMDGKPPSNVWIGTSVEDQQRAEERIPELLNIPAKVRFLSVEPLLGPVDLKGIYHMVKVAGMEATPNILKGHVSEFSVSHRKCGIHWVIVGGESGQGARPCNIEWIRSIVAQCKAAGVPVFCKQLGAFPVTDESTPDGWPVGTELETNPACTSKALVKLKHKKGGDMEEWATDLRVRQFPKGGVL